VRHADREADRQAGYRRDLKDGVWEGQTTQQEPVELNLVAGGRALVSLAGPGPGGAKEYAFGLAPSNDNDACSYEHLQPGVRNRERSFLERGHAPRRRGGAVRSIHARQRRHRRVLELQEACPQESWTAGWSFNPSSDRSAPAAGTVVAGPRAGTACDDDDGDGSRWLGLGQRAAHEQIDAASAPAR